MSQDLILQLKPRGGISVRTQSGNMGRMSRMKKSKGTDTLSSEVALLLSFKTIKYAHEKEQGLGDTLVVKSMRCS